MSAVYGLWLAGLVSALVALATGNLPAKLAVPVWCALALGVQTSRCPAHLREVAPVIFAFICSLVGDYFLSSRAGRLSWFLAGIGAFLAAHLGYLAYALAHGRFHRPTLLAALAAIVAYYALALAPSVPDSRLSLAVLAYAVVSCASLAAAAGLRQPAPAKACFVGGISLLVFSDTVISLVEFCHWRRLGWLILPTYYLALLLITAGVLQAGRPLPWTRSHRRQSAQPAGAD